MSLHQAVQLVTAAITSAREQRIPKLLVDASGLTDLDPPNIGSRYFFVHEWGNAAGGAVRIALVVPPEMIDRQKFGITVAANVGLVSDVFSSEPAALAWLQSIG